MTLRHVGSGEWDEGRDDGGWAWRQHAPAAESGTPQGQRPEEHSDSWRATPSPPPPAVHSVPPQPTRSPAGTPAGWSNTDSWSAGGAWTPQQRAGDEHSGEVRGGQPAPAERSSWYQPRPEDNRWGHPASAGYPASGTTPPGNQPRPSAQPTPPGYPAQPGQPSGYPPANGSAGANGYAAPPGQAGPNGYPGQGGYPTQPGPPAQSGYSTAQGGYPPAPGGYRDPMDTTAGRGIPYPHSPTDAVIAQRPVGPPRRDPRAMGPGGDGYPTGLRPVSGPPGYGYPAGPRPVSAPPSYRPAGRAQVPMRAVGPVEVNDEPEYRRSIIYTTAWYLIPCLAYVAWALTLESGRRTFVLDSFGSSLLWVAGAAGISLLMATILCWAAREWRALTVSFAAAVIGAGVATIAHSLSIGG